MVDVQKWRVGEVVQLLGEHLDQCGGRALSIATGRDLLVKARARDDGVVNVWVDGLRSSMPPAVAASLEEHDLGSGGADLVVDSEPAESPNGLVLMTVDTDAADPPDRSDECRRAAEALALERLVDAGPDAVLHLDDEALKARTRHVITETARIRAAERAIESGAWSQLGAILTASHSSLRDDFEVSCAELDVTAEAAVEAGALGARMTLALVPAERVAAVRELVERRFDGVGWRRPGFRSLPVAEAALRH